MESTYKEGLWCTNRKVQKSSLGCFLLCGRPIIQKIADFTTLHCILLAQYRQENKERSNSYGNVLDIYVY